MNKKAVALLSGGLDSTLAIRVMQDQGVEMVALNFVTPFCNCTGRNSGCKNEAKKVADELNVPIKVMSKGKEYLEVVRNPQFGYGSNMNPCIDCRIFMYKRAKEYMAEIGASFIITGEVLGQRPMSQRMDSMNIIERESGLKGLILRPLSAHFFPLTMPEKEGIVDREKLLKISGRGRKEQMKLADNYDIKDYHCPAGGCLLTDEGFARRIKDIFAHCKEINMNDIYLLRLGRHFRLDDETKLIIGREEDENKKIEVYNRDGAMLLRPYDAPGPTALMTGNVSDENVKKALKIIARYLKKDINNAQFSIMRNGEETLIHNSERLSDEAVNSMII